jgi:hypothetical protein
MVWHSLYKGEGAEDDSKQAREGDLLVQVYTAILLC